MVNVSHDDAVAFCAWATKQTKRPVALPTEAQFEYACRGGTDTIFFTGDEASSLEGSCSRARIDGGRSTA